MTHEECTNVKETRGNSGLTVFGKKSAAELPEEVVENIISRIPFPSLFKARVLSKTWYFNLPLAPQSVKSLSPSVQNLVSSVSSKWPTYCPCYVSQEAILGFKRASARWQTLMSISHLRISHLSTCHSSYVSSAGPLVCVTELGNFSVLVTNSLNRSWRKLNFPRPFTFPREPTVKIILQGSDAYKVLVVFQRGENSVYSNVYDSSTRTYKGNTSVGVSSCCIYPVSAYLNGKVYYLFNADSGWNWVYMGGVSLWIYNVENNEWSTISNSHLDKFGICADCGVLLCNDKVMVAVCTVIDNKETPLVDDEGIEYCFLCNLEESIHIFELDIVTLELKPVSTGPPQIIYGVCARDVRANFPSDSNFIYFGQALRGTTVLSYNIHNDEWNCLPPASFKSSSKKWMMENFQPGLCPFMIV